ncbi:hypothetical protein, partial [Klebsiella pneumoniae]|uniref:hypothetical protein n=1 Tax=Klebsiella pneumoniae TaxID=573 RepID=UPI00405557C9
TRILREFLITIPHGIKCMKLFEKIMNSLFSDLQPPPLPARWQRIKSAGADKQVDILDTGSVELELRVDTESDTVDTRS